MVRTLNQAIVKATGADPAATNPSRLMRLPGSIAWPYKDGRVPELVTWVNGSDGSYTVEQLAAAFGAAPPPPARPVSPPPAQREPQQTPQQTAQAQQAAPADGADATVNATEIFDTPETLLKRVIARRPPWNKTVLRLVGMLIERGVPPGVIEAMAPTLTWSPEYTVEKTFKELGPMIRGALRKGYAPDDGEADAQDESVEDVMDVRPAKSPRIQFLTDTEVEALPDPTWLIDDTIVEDSLVVLYGPWGSCKSFLALDWALSIATGADWQGKAVAKAGVLYLCAEGVGGLKNRIAAWKQHHDVTGSIEGIRIVPHTINLMDRASAELLVLSAVEAQKASGFAPEEGLVREDGRVNPLNGIIVKQALVMLKAASELAFAPVARARIGNMVPEEETEPEPGSLRAWLREGEELHARTAAEAEARRAAKKRPN